VLFHNKKVWSKYEKPSIEDGLGIYVKWYILAIIFGPYVGISETVQRSIIPKYVITEFRGTAYGFYSLVIGVCFFASNITFGFIWDNYNIQMAVGYSIS
jgi:MFS-type transporter involved in bile tolerance (Atg22 family)